MYLPVFLVWDETLPTAFADSVKNRLRHLNESFVPALGVNVYVHVGHLTSDGGLADGRRYKGNGFPFDVLRSGDEVRANLSFELANLPISRVTKMWDADEGNSDSLPPLVLLFVNRPLGDVYFPEKSVLNLLGHETKPRLAVLAASSAGAWALPKEVIDRKEVVAFSVSDDESVLAESIDKIQRFIEGKVNERRGQVPTPTVPSSAQTPPASTSPSPPPPPPSSVPRPVISLVTDPPASTAQKGAAPPARPSIEFASSQDSSGVPNGSGVASKPAPQQAPSVSSSPSPSAPSKSSEPESRPDPAASSAAEISNDDRRGIVARLLGRKKQETTNDPASHEPNPGAAGAGENEAPAEPESIEHDSIESTWPAEETTADGQVVIDHSSSLNAKPWYAPKWKKLPERGPSRDLEVDLGSLGNLRVIAGSTRGTKHQYYGEENQDSFFIARTGNSRYVVIAVSDGVGSAEYSAYGSRFLSNFVAGTVAFELGDQVEATSEDIKRLVLKTISDASDRVQQWRPGDLYAPAIEPTPENKNLVSATLCVVVVPVEARGDGTRDIVLACVGDSPCYTLNKDVWTLQSVSTKEGALLEHGTYALPTEIGKEPLVDSFVFSMMPSDVLVLMTDGIGTSLASGDTPVGRWLAPRLYGPQLMTDLIHTLDFVQTLTADRQGEDDDRTLAVVFDFEGLQQASVPPEEESPASSEGAASVEASAGDH